MIIKGTGGLGGWRTNGEQNTWSHFQKGVENSGGDMQKAIKRI